MQKVRLMLEVNIVADNIPLESITRDIEEAINNGVDSVMNYPIDKLTAKPIKVFMIEGISE